MKILTWVAKLLTKTRIFKFYESVNLLFSSAKNFITNTVYNKQFLVAPVQ